MLSQKRTTLETTLKIISVLASFAVNLGGFPSATDVALEPGKMQLCGYSFLPVSLLKTILGILQTSLENGLCSQLHISKNETGIFFIRIKYCVRGGACQSGVNVEYFKHTTSLLCRGNRKRAEYEIPELSQNCTFESDFKPVVYWWSELDFFSPKIKSSPVKGSEQFLTGSPGVGRSWFEGLG